MSAPRPSTRLARAQRTARIAWPVGLALPLIAASRYPDLSFEGAGPALVAVMIASVVLAVLCCGFAVGGVKGAAVGVALGCVAAFCAWWLSLGFNANLSRYGWDDAADGLARWASYLSGLATNLWPMLVAVGVVAWAVARKRDRSAWHAVGLLTIVLVLLSTPYRSSWYDGCNYHGGAAPALLTPVAGTLMDHGVGVMPDYDSTQMGCYRRGPDGTGESLSDVTWKPFWRGSDGLPNR